MGTCRSALNRADIAEIMISIAARRGAGRSFSTQEGRKQDGRSRSTNPEWLPFLRRVCELL
jgi:hypothetical protein